MKRVFILILIIVGFSFCKNNKTSVENVQPVISDMDWFVRKFSLPYDVNLLADSNSLLFYSTGHFDTSFLININKRDSVIFCTYYQTLPSNHRSIDDYLEDSSQLISFEGFSFRINDSVWQSLLRKITPDMLNEDTLGDYKNACFDCKLYLLSHNFLLRGNTDKNRGHFRVFAEYIQHDIINPLRKKRRI